MCFVWRMRYRFRLSLSLDLTSLKKNLKKKGDKREWNWDFPFILWFSTVLNGYGHTVAQVVVICFLLSCHPTQHTHQPLCNVFYLVQCTRLAGAWKCVTGSRTRKKNPYFQVAKRFDCDEWPVCVFSVPIHINKSERPDRTSTPRQHATSHKMSCPSVYVHQTCQNLLFFFFFLFLASWRSVCDFSHETVFLFSFWQFVCRRVFFFF